MPKLTITLTDEEKAALEAWAKQQCRYPNDQVKFIILEKLRELDKPTAQVDIKQGEQGPAPDGM